MSKPTLHVTTPMYYVNDIAHIGHAYTTIAGDVLCRYRRMTGYDVFYTTGTDEHGQKIAEAAEAKGLAPQQLADNVVTKFVDLWDTLNIDYQSFSRTTNDGHKTSVQNEFQSMFDNGDIYLGKYSGYYCVPCESFWTDTQLGEGEVCPSCNRGVKIVEEDSYFFRLSKYQDKLLQHIKDNPNFIQPEARRNEVVSFIESGLNDLSVSRTSFDWGIHVPFDNKHVVYVWLDALSSYITALGYGTPDGHFQKYWGSTIHLVGKDILRFHTIYWPAFLMSMGVELPKQVFAHGWWTVEGQKMSKSLGNSINPVELVNDFGADAVRYFLLQTMPFGNDGNFSYEVFISKINHDLSNDYGNLVNRVAQMVHKHFNSVMPHLSSTHADARENPETYKKLFPLEHHLDELLDQTVRTVDAAMDTLSFNEALKGIRAYITATNKYVDSAKPWTVATEGDMDRLGDILNRAMNASLLATRLLSPFIPETADKVFVLLGVENPRLANSHKLKADMIGGGQKITFNTQLFPKVDAKAYLDKRGATATTATTATASTATTSTATTTEGTTDAVATVGIDEFFKTQILAGKIVAATAVPKSSKLLQLSVDFGGAMGTSENATIVAGVKKTYAPEDLVGKTVAFAANIKPTKIMGVLSQGMILAVDNGTRHFVMELDASVAPGTRIK